MALSVDPRSYPSGSLRHHMAPRWVVRCHGVTGHLPRCHTVCPGAQGWTGGRRLPEEHLAGFAVGSLVKRVHLEAVMVGVGLVWFDV